MKLNVKLRVMLAIQFVFAIISAVSLFAGNAAATGITLAVVGGMYNTDMAAYRALLAKEMEYAAVQIPFWSDFMGFIGSADKPYPISVNVGSGRTKLLKPTGKPIEVLTNFEHEGGVTMDIPVAFSIGGQPQYGDTPVRGKEERRKLGYKTCAVNQVRKGVLIQDGRMSKQVLKKDAVQKELMQTAQRELLAYNHKWGAYQPYMAFLQRYSDNLTASAVDDGLGLTKYSHPNFFVAGDGQVAFSDTHATYEAAVAAKLAGLTDTASDHFSTKVIENMVYYASILRIQPVAFGKNGFYPIVINGAQAIQLFQDEKWLAANTHGAPRSEELNRLFTGILVGVYRNAMIYVDNSAPGVKINGDDGFTAAASTTGTTAGVQYGNVDFIDNPLDTSDKKLAILFGASSVVCGYASPLGFDQETWDYANNKSEASNMIIGFERSDIYDRDGFFGTSGNFKENTSSLVCATYSPSAPEWV